MARTIPEKFMYFLKNGIKDADDGFEYACELNRILSSDDCQHAFNSKEIEIMREFADKVKSVGEINHYTEVRINEIENEHFGTRGMMGFLGAANHELKPTQWPF